MILYLVFPPEVILPADNKTVECSALYGVSFDLQCQMFLSNRTLKLTNAFPFPSEPKKISFSVSPLTNPSSIIKTSSFSISTFTYDYYSLDSRNTSLILDMECQLPCKSCVSINIYGCNSCYNEFTNPLNASVTNLPFLFDNYCYDICPDSTY